MTKTTKEEFLKLVDWWQPTVYIMRGLPGSGKSTLVKEIIKTISYLKGDCRGTYVCSADSFWIQSDGSYKFDQAKVPQNHYQCLKDFCYAAQFDDANSIFVDNTNTAYREFSHYIKIAQAFGYKVVIITLNVLVGTSLKRNKHNVPEKVIQGMYKRLNESNENLSEGEPNVFKYFIDTEQKVQ